MTVPRPTVAPASTNDQAPTWTSSASCASGATMAVGCTPGSGRWRSSSHCAARAKATRGRSTTMTVRSGGSPGGTSTHEARVAGTRAR